MSKIRQPLLVVAAERDQYVRVHHADTLAGFGRARKKDPGVAVVTVPGINHLLVPAATGQVEEYGSLRDQAVSAGVAKEIAAWIFAP